MAISDKTTNNETTVASGGNRHDSTPILSIGSSRSFVYDQHDHYSSDTAAGTVTAMRQRRLRCSRLNIPEVTW